MSYHQSFTDKLAEFQDLISEKSAESIIIPEVFWCNGTKQKGCCFNHFIGLPTRKIKTKDGSNINGQEMPIFQYEMMIVDHIEQYDFYALNKARGIGATEIILRWILWKALINRMPGRKFIIITGINLDLARDEMIRLFGMMENMQSLVLKKSAYSMILQYSMILALPARAAAIRGFENVEALFLDESAHWLGVDDGEVLEASEPHNTKSGAKIIVTSTPNGRRGYFAKIFHDSETQYYPETMPWLVSTGLLIDPEKVAKIKKSDPYKYEQEYNCQFLTTRYSAIPQEALNKLEHSGEGYTLE